MPVAAPEKSGKVLMKKLLKWSGIVVLLAIIALAIVPFLIPVKPLDGLKTAQALARPDDRFVTLPFAGTDGIDIRYRDSGNAGTGRTFLMLHGSVFNAATWDEVTDALAAKGRVVAYDQIPYGLSEKLVPGDWAGASPYRIEAAVARIFQLMDALGIGQATLVANSYGAVLAVRAAAAHPERLDGLVLGDAAVYVNESMPAWLMNLPQVERLGPLVARGIGASDRFVDATWLHPDAMNDARRSKTLIHSQVENWDAAFWGYLKVWQMSDLGPAIAGITQPTLVISGEGDGIVPVEESRRLQQSIPGSELVVLPNCGHVPQEECPAAYSAAVLDWIERAS